MKKENVKSVNLENIWYIKSPDSGNLKITNLDRLIFTKNGELTI